MENTKNTDKSVTISEAPIKRSSSLSTRRKSLVKLKSRASLEKPLRKLSFQIKSNIDKLSLPIKDLIVGNDSSDTEPQSPSNINKSHGFLNAFQLNSKSSHSQRRVILNVGGVKHEGIFIKQSLSIFSV